MASYVIALAKRRRVSSTMLSRKWRSWRRTGVLTLLRRDRRTPVSITRSAVMVRFLHARSPSSNPALLCRCSALILTPSAPFAISSHFPLALAAYMWCLCWATTIDYARLQLTELALAACRVIGNRETICLNSKNLGGHFKTRQDGVTENRPTAGTGNFRSRTWSSALQSSLI